MRYAVVIVAACSSVPIEEPDSGPDATVDAPIADVSQADSATGADAGPGADCGRPSDCNTGYCCATLQFNGGSPPDCVIEAGSSSCNAQCNPNISISCIATDTLRFCSTNNDCPDASSGYSSCCTVKFDDAATTFCWSPGLASAAGGTCM